MEKKIFKTIVMVFVCATLALGCATFVGCGDDTPKVNSIKLNKNELILMEKDTEILIATIDPSGISVTWSSSDRAKVIVDQTGKVVGISETTTPVTVTATAGDKSATCTVIVTPRPVEYEEVASIIFDAGNLVSETYTEDIELCSGVMWATADDSIKDGKNNGDIKVEDKGRDFGDKKFTKSLKLNGKGNAEKRSIKLVLEKSAKILVYSKSGSAGTPRIVNLYSSEYTKIDGQTFSIDEEKDGKVLIVKNAGTYYIGTETGSISIYGIEIFYEI